MGKRTHINSSDDEEGSENEVQNLDDMTVSQMKEALHESQLRANKAKKTALQALGNITNSTSDPDLVAISKEEQEAGKEPKEALAEESESEVLDDKESEEKEVASLGRRFVLMKGLWIKKDSVVARLNEDYDKKRRFDDAQVQGQLRDLLDILPDCYRGKVRREGWFKRAFLDSMRAIAAASILAIWGKSSDRCLHPRGDSTNINYEAHFDEYLDILTTGLRKKSPSILHRKKHRNKSDGYHCAMEAMEAEQDGLGNQQVGEDGGNQSAGE
ncbi:hypothetical protein C8R44DRAFT_888766 [Mycena epipterygia]|nr:hypothetical protein C8R44DRAFT_888766 [Mycena epipterygia]